MSLSHTELVTRFVALDMALENTFCDILNALSPSTALRVKQRDYQLWTELAYALRHVAQLYGVDLTKERWFSNQ